MKHIPALVAAISAFALGAVWHDWAWPHSSLYPMKGAVVSNLKIDKWGGALIVVNGEIRGEFTNMHVVNQGPFPPLSVRSKGAE